jgi:hypothetical protein
MADPRERDWERGEQRGGRPRFFRGGRTQGEWGGYEGPEDFEGREESRWGSDDRGYRERAYGGREPGWRERFEPPSWRERFGVRSEEDFGGRSSGGGRGEYSEDDRRWRSRGESSYGSPLYRRRFEQRFPEVEDWEQPRSLAEHGRGMAASGRGMGEYGRGEYEWGSEHRSEYPGQVHGRFYGGGAGLGEHAGRGPKGYKRSDDRLREDVCDRLTEDAEVDAREITVQVRDGEVTLQGTVPARSMKRAAEDCAESVSGVQQVHNQLRVESNGGGQEQGRGGPSGEGQSGRSFAAVSRSFGASSEEEPERSKPGGRTR